MLKTSLKTLAVLGLLTAGLLSSNMARAEALTKEQVQQIVHEYIQAHPEEILKSVDDYQQRTMETRQDAAVKNNKDALYKDEKSPTIGNPKGDVTVVEFFDYNCGYCKRTFPELKALIDSDKNVKVVFKDFPILGPTSETAARWALALQKQGKYFEFHQKMMAHNGPITDALLEDTAKSVGADVAKAKNDMDSTDVTLQIERNRNLASQMGISGTPAFVIGDTLIPGATTKAVMEQKVAEARTAKGEDNTEKTSDKADKKDSK